MSSRADREGEHGGVLREGASQAELAQVAIGGPETGAETWSRLLPDSARRTAEFASVVRGLPLTRLFRTRTDVV